MIFVLFEIYIDSGVNRPPDFRFEVFLRLVRIEGVIFNFLCEMSLSWFFRRICAVTSRDELDPFLLQRFVLRSIGKSYSYRTK